MRLAAATRPPDSRRNRGTLSRNAAAPLTPVLLLPLPPWLPPVSLPSPALPLLPRLLPAPPLLSPPLPSRPAPALPLLSQPPLSSPLLSLRPHFPLRFSLLSFSLLQLELPPLAPLRPFVPRSSPPRLWLPHLPALPVPSRAVLRPHFLPPVRVLLPWPVCAVALLPADVHASARHPAVVLFLRRAQEVSAVPALRSGRLPVASRQALFPCRSKARAWRRARCRKWTYPE